jgi:hypothetical protein
MISCPHCGHEHPDNARFCPLTGKTITTALRTCPRCGKATRAEWSRCPYCAAVLRPETGEFSQSGRWWLISIGFASILLLVGGWLFRDDLQPIINSILAFVNTPTPTVSIVIAPSREPSNTLPSKLTAIAITNTSTSIDTITPAPSASPTTYPTLTIAPSKANLSSERSTALNPTMPPNQPLRSGDVLEATYLDIPPILDGNLDEWNLSAYPISKVVYGPERYRNANDLSANLMIGWDEDHLYLGIQVMDDQYSQNAIGDQIFKGDHVELLLDTDLSGDFSNKKLNSDDYQLGLSLGRGLRSSTNYLWYPKSIEGAKLDILISGNPIEDGYILEAAIPLRIFQVVPGAGKFYGFAISVSDNDQLSENTQETMVSTAINRKLSDPTTWGNLLLVK